MSVDLRLDGPDLGVFGDLVLDVFGTSFADFLVLVFTRGVTVRDTPFRVGVRLRERDRLFRPTAVDQS